MDKAGFMTIFPTYSNLEVVKQTLPSVIEETARYDDARLIVHDSTEIDHDQEAKWNYLREMEQKHGFFLILSTNLSMAHARNMCLHLGQEMFAPDYICMIEDDHGFRNGMIQEVVEVMRKFYGKRSPCGLRYGMFSACHAHTHAKLISVENDQYFMPDPDSEPFQIGGYNSCFRCAPTSHWNNVLKGYDTDEYLISTYQTSNLRWRNYHKGFTVMFVGDGSLIFEIEAEGRGMTSTDSLKLWDEKYCASDPRSRFEGKNTSK